MAIPAGVLPAYSVALGSLDCSTRMSPDVS